MKRDNQKVSAYFSASIRGRDGDGALFSDMAKNLKKGAAIAAKIKERFGAVLDLYVPHDHDAVIQILLLKGYITGDQVVEADCVLLEERDFLISYVPDKYYSGGMVAERDAAIELGRPRVEFIKPDEIGFIRIQNVISEILKG
ncbi:MAG TPA: hypothetical protein ENI23_16810 [bacterium]|nr:hypothetical protein [bacterium]